MNEETTTENSNEEVKSAETSIPEVYTLRGWKEYAGESLLIIFSVLLALILTEFINNLHEKKQFNELLNNIRNELITNKKYAQEQYAYNKKVIRSIDSALTDPTIQRKIINNDEFHLKYIAPQGVLYRFFDDVAWEQAKSLNISSKLNFKTISLLSNIYADQTRIMKVEDEIGKVVLSYEARKPENAHITLMLIRDNYSAWAVDRAPTLISSYDEAIKELEK
ncbi:hypothetical protein JN11_04707 [Mucilaginibacter frigoritolerans]|jgi:hypothetical protein|uniref:Uncharacterized protein n=1 Tax=Mucilaginibacter frigoritolerans TaxID=652788 RepID=A0A562TNC1_9SPHI|nr:hypothetical protein [Mucilaginibacter frigoritolerans]TWI94596.1 hypothetical protein JN11_04707 [Mucilaginibacter frigoritolerans]